MPKEQISEHSESKHSDPNTTQESNAASDLPADAQQHLEVPSDHDQQSRSSSPGLQQTATNEFRIQNQVSRLAMLQRIDQQMTQKLPTSREEVEGQYEHAKAVWSEFISDHDHLGRTCKKNFFDHPYMTGRFYELAMTAYHSISSAVFTARAEINKKTAQEAQESARSSSKSDQVRHRSTLPELKLPHFNGDFAAWPEFRDLFKSMVIDNDQLSNVEKLHYLKSSLSGAPAQLISSVPMSNDSFIPAWKQITQRFNDKERLIMSYVERLHADITTVKRTAHDLNKLVSTTNETLEALKALGVPVQHWNYELLYLITRRLDSTLREAWEVKRSSSSEPMTFGNLMEFITARAKALEAVQVNQEQIKPSSALRPQKPMKRATYVASISAQDPNSYPCDHCKEPHFIALCSKFKDLHPTDRYKFVVDQRLCFNCLGHHNLANCYSTRTCRTCNSRHHTLLHLPAQQAAASQNRSAAGSSTSRSAHSRT